MPTIVRLVGVYDADGGLRGELAYLAGKFRGQHCSLCDITHSPVRRRRDWDDYVSSLPVPLEVVHRNERDADMTAATSGLEPCVAAECPDGSIVIVLDDAALQGAGDVRGFSAALEDALERNDLVWPDAITS